MSVTDHLTELRKTVIRIVIVLFASFIVCYTFGDILSEFLLAPLRNNIGGADKIVYIGILDKVISFFQVAFWSSIIVSSPVWFYLLWNFIKPGLHDHEIRSIRPFIFISFILFCLGIGFGQFIVFPLNFKTLMGFGVQNIEATLSLKDYLALASKVLVFLGMVFQLPNIILILGIMGIVNSKSLNKMRRYVYAGFSILSAMLTPPDILTMLGLWIPLIALYEMGVIVVMIFVRKKKEK